MAGNSPISRAGTRSQRPTGSSALTAGAGRPSNPTASWPARTAAPSWPSTSPGCGSPCRRTGATIIREGHGTGEGRGTSPGEVHDIALKAAETDATKRALATFGRPFGLELYRKEQAEASSAGPACSRPCLLHRQSAPRLGFHPDDTTPIPRPSHYYGRRQHSSTREFFPKDEATARATDLQLHHRRRPRHRPSCPRPHRQEPARHRRAQASARQGASEVRRLTAVPGLRPAAVRSASPALCAAASHRSQSQRRVHRAALPRSSPATASGRQ